MTVYLAAFASVLASSLVFFRLKDKSAKRITFFVGFTVMFLLLALRADTVGTDTSGYLRNFSNIANAKSMREVLSTAAGTEKGYIFFVRLLTFVLATPRAYVVVWSAIVTIVAGFSFYRLCNNKFSATLIIVFFALECYAVLFSAFRQGLALVLVLASYVFVKNKKPIWFLLLILLASTMHRSALVGLALFPLSYVRLSLRHLPFVFLLAIVIYLAAPTFFRFVLAQPFMPAKYGYITVYSVNSAFGMVAFYALLTVFLFVFGGKDADSYFYKNTMIIVMFFQIVSGYLFGGAGMRMGYYFLIFTPLAVTNALGVQLEKNGVYAFLMSILINAVMIGMFVYTVGRTDLGLIPYTFFWA